MFGAASEIMTSQFILQNKENKYDKNLFMYIMNVCLHHPNNNIVFENKPLINNILYTTNEKLSKYETLMNVGKNIFLTTGHKSNYMSIFSLSQKIYFAFSRLAFIWKYKRAVRGNTTDMMMNDIHPGERGVVEVFQHGSIYMFRTHEINRIVENSICNTDCMFANPKAVKNPFNNLPFTKANLYTMYFGIEKMAVSKLPVIFYKYFAVDFNLQKFYEQNHAIIREKGIQDYFKNSQTDDLYEDVFDMLDYIRSYSPRRFKFDISDECCKCCIVKVMKPYLKLYLTHRHSLDSYVVKQSLYELRHKLFMLFEYNPAFGRKLRVKNHVGLDKKTSFKITYNLKHPCNHISFNKDEYKKTHLDSSFIDREDFRSRQQNEYEMERQSVQEDRPSILNTFVHSIALQHIRVNNNENHNERDDEVSYTSTDSDDEDIIVPAYVPSTRSRSDTEDGEIVEDNILSDNESSTELDFTLDYTGDASLNDVSAISQVNETGDTEIRLDELSETINRLCAELDREFDEDPDSRKNQLDC